MIIQTITPARSAARMFMYSLVVACAVLLMSAVAPAAHAAPVTQTFKFTASDGKKLHTIVSGEGNLDARPLIVEFTPYGPTDAGSMYGPSYNSVVVHMRGTGLSTGKWDAIGARDQLDVAEFLGWACNQSFSDGRIGLHGFSASAIAVYTSMHRALPCVKAAALGAGINSLYRDLMYPGGIANILPGAAVGAGVTGPMLGLKLPAADLPGAAESTAGMLEIAANFLGRPLEDEWWAQHTVRPGPNDFPILMANGFYDVESRGAFENYKALKATNPGSHLLVKGAHDGSPAGTPSPFEDYKRWMDHYVRGVANGIDAEPAVQLYLSKGSRGDLIAGRYKRVDATDWPVPGTNWQRLYLNPARAGSAAWSLNDGSLTGSPATGPWWFPSLTTVQSYPAVSSLVPAGDPNTMATVIDTLAGFGSLPPLVDMNTANGASLTYTTTPLNQAVDLAGPIGMNINLATSALDADIHAVLADVHPDGRAFAVAQGRLKTSFPQVDNTKSMFDTHGENVQPYAIHDARNYALPLTTREYKVEFWPVGNRFEAGHRLRLYVMGTSPLMLPPAPGINSVSTGQSMRSRIMLPVLPGSNLCAAIGAGSGCS